MKTSPFVSSQAKKTRKSFFQATKEDKHVAMSAPLSKELRQTHGIKNLPIRRDDEVRVARGKYEGREGRVTAVKLSTMRVYVDQVQFEKISGQTVSVPLHPSNLVITKLKMDKYRKGLIERRKIGHDKALAKLGHSK